MLVAVPTLSPLPRVRLTHQVQAEVDRMLGVVRHHMVTAMGQEALLCKLDNGAPPLLCTIQQRIRVESIRRILLGEAAQVDHGDRPRPSTAQTLQAPPKALLRYQHLHPGRQKNLLQHILHMPLLQRQLPRRPMHLHQLQQARTMLGTATIRHQHLLHHIQRHISQLPHQQITKTSAYVLILA